MATLPPLQMFQFDLNITKSMNISGEKLVLELPQENYFCYKISSLSVSFIHRAVWTNIAVMADWVK